MKHISILIPRGDASVNCIEGTYTVFNQLNVFLEESGKSALFTVQTVGLSKQAQLYNRSFSIIPDLVVADAPKTDLIIIPAINGDVRNIIAMNQDFLPWIQKQYKEGAEVASLCVGTFLLGATGLLKRKKCVTHWYAVNHFRKMFPDAELEADKIFTDDQGIYSSAGGNSFWNLLLHLIEKYTDREMSIFCAKYFEIEIDRKSQSPFNVFNGYTEHHDAPVRKAQSFIENNIQSKITVGQLSIMVDIGRRTLERRFKKATHYTVSEYIHQMKMEAAKKEFETGRKSIHEIMRDIGYSDPKAFRLIFKKTTGLSPAEYKTKFRSS
jgi:transcriptional regulator GlxA family with amidase domain